MAVSLSPLSLWFLVILPSCHHHPLTLTAATSSSSHCRLFIIVISFSPQHLSYLSCHVTRIAVSLSSFSHSHHCLFPLCHLTSLSLPSHWHLSSTHSNITQLINFYRLIVISLFSLLHIYFFTHWHCIIIQFSPHRLYYRVLCPAEQMQLVQCWRGQDVGCWQQRWQKVEASKMPNATIFQMATTTCTDETSASEQAGWTHGGHWLELESDHGHDSEGGPSNTTLITR